MEETNLRQADAKVTVIGVLAEKNLEKVVEDNVEKIKGSLTLKTSDVNFIRFNVSVNAKTKTGTDNKVYAGIQTIMNNYKSIADVGEDDADVISVTNGSLNLYTGRDGSSQVSYQSNFFNRVKDPENIMHKAEFEVEVYIASITSEMNGEEETGRIVVTGWVPTYNGIEQIKLVATDDVADAVESMFTPRQTVRFFGDIINNRIEKVIEIPVAIGKPRKKITTTYKNDLVITGASAPYEEDDAIKPYVSDVINAAIQERKNRIEEKRNNSTTTKPSGAAHGRTLGF